jgi:serine/threonine protein kinase
MELCEGGDLFSYIHKRTHISEEIASAIIYKLLTAVSYLQLYGIIHRDLKPENILIANKQDFCDIRLVDFGLSKILGPNELCSEPYGTIVRFMSN